MEWIKPGIKLNFVGNMKYAAIFSGTIVILSWCTLLWPGIRWGIDFAGGTEIHLRLDPKLQIDQLRQAVDELKLGGEDYVLAKRACSYGKCLFIPDAMVTHEARGSLSKIWKWFERRGQAEVKVLRSIEQNNITKWTILKSSITIKAFIFLIIGVILYRWFILYVMGGILFFISIQYFRYFKTWRYSRSSLYSLALMPLVKFVMDSAMDYGRLRNLFSD